MSLTKLQIQSLYPEVYESFSLQASLPDSKYDEKVKFWETNGINCFDRWTVPYFLDRDREKKRPCLRLNYPPDGKCADCSKNCCRYDKICFVCGQEGHGAFQTFPGGKLKGELKCTKHRTLVYQLAKIRLQFGLSEDEVRSMFKLPPSNPNSAGSIAVANSLAATQMAVTATVPKKVTPGAPPGSAPPAGTSSAAAAANSARIPGVTSSGDLSQGSNGSDPAPRIGSPASKFNSPDRVSSGALDFLGGSIPGGASLFYDQPAPSASAATQSSPHSQPQGQYQAVDITDCDEYGATPQLRFSVRAMARERRGGGSSSVVDSASGPLIGKGAMVFSRGSSGYYDGSVGVAITEDVLMRAWKKYEPQVAGAAAAVEALHGAVRAEIGQLRVLARRSLHIARVVHMGVLELPASVTVDESNGYGSNNNVGALSCLVSEFSDMGQLDRFAAQYFQSHPQGFSVPDLQNAAVQLIETLHTCHEMNVRHREIRPFNILISRCTDKYYPHQLCPSRQTGQGLILKLSNFTPVSVLAMHNLMHTPEQHAAVGPLSADIERWIAPEVDNETRRTGVKFQPTSDVWSMGLVLFYMASGGQLPFESHAQAVEACTSNPDLRRACLEKYGIQEKCPALYDLLERLLRPAYMRTDLRVIRCHPFLWSTELRRRMLVNFAATTAPVLPPALLQQLPNQPPLPAQVAASVQNFTSAVEKIAPLYVFGSDGWVIQMSAALAETIQPHKLKTEFWWSGVCLLQAVKAHLESVGTAGDVAGSSALQGAMTTILQMRARNNAGGVSPPGTLTPQQAVTAYVHQITDTDFPRLLILIFELGGINGRWIWDGDEVVHIWN